MTRDKRFNIDFFEFSFLVEACIPPRPIARSMFWDEVINVHYHNLTEDERARLFEWINRNGQMESSLEKGDEQCLVFNARYNPDNQYRIETLYNGKKESYDVFKFKDRYYTEYYNSRNKSIEKEFITKIDKL